MFTTLLSGIAGGLLRLAPEFLKLWDRKNERVHEYQMAQLQKELMQIQGDYRLREADYQVEATQLSAYLEAHKEQGLTARAAGRFVAGISALVRPVVTYWFVGMYSAVKIASMVRAYQLDADWKEMLISCWTVDDFNILVMILAFWFVGRVWERNKR